MYVNILEIYLIKNQKKSKINKMIVTDSQELKEICQRFATHPFVTVDTEFLREFTYYSKLCLIQLASPEEAFCIDPLAENMDLTPLFDLMMNERVVKVFHSARQDIENFYMLMNKVPAPLFDTQVAAMVCGYGESVGYQQLVLDLLKVQIDKGMRFTNWEKRPLSEAQEQYALSDVTYLRDVYLILKKKLEDAGRGSWIEEEMQLLLDEESYNPSDATISKKIKYNVKSEKLKFLYQDLYLWREHRAKRLNRSKRQILRDETLQEIVKAHPKTVDELKNLRGIPASFFKNNIADEIVFVINKSFEKEKEAFYPIPVEKNTTGARKNLMLMLHMLLDVVSVQEETAAKVIALHEELVWFASGDDTVRFMQGWRYDIFGKYAVEVKKGTLFFAYNPATYRVEFCVKNDLFS